MGHLILQGDGISYHGFSLLSESSLAVTFDETGTSGLVLDFLVLSGTTTVGIASTHTGAIGGYNYVEQLAEKTNDLTTVTIRPCGRI